MVYLLITVVFAAVAALIAYDKGRNVVAWFVAGFFLGPFGLAVAVLPPKPRRGQYAECPACLEVVKYEATVCRYCGTEFEH